MTLTENFTSEYSTAAGLTGINRLTDLRIQVINVVQLYFSTVQDGGTTKGSRS